MCFEVTIHQTSVIHPDAVLGEGASVGPHSTIGANVRIGDHTQIGANVLIEPGTVIGRRCRVFHGASIGGEPQILDFKDVPSSVTIGDETTIREYVTVHRSGKENGATVVGSKCMVMAYAHIAHDCEIGDEVIIVNGTGLSGHVVVEDRAFISGLVGVHQFVRIGKHAMVGGKAGLNQDVLPFSMVEGTPARLVGVNSVGLRRSQFPTKVRTAIKKAFKFFLRSDLNTSQAVERIEREIEMSEEIRYLVNFVKNSSRGITK